MRKSISLMAVLLVATILVPSQVKTVVQYIEQVQTVASRADMKAQGHRESYLVRISEAVHRVMGFDPPITNAGSNNSSAALLAGISSISTGAGPCDGSHSLAENCEIELLYKGIKKILLLEVALAGVE